MYGKASDQGQMYVVRGRPVLLALIARSAKTVDINMTKHRPATKTLKCTISVCQENGDAGVSTENLPNGSNQMSVQYKATYAV